MSVDLSPLRLAALMDHTLLQADAGRQAVERLCEEARAEGFYAVCVNPLHAAMAARRLRDAMPRVCCVCAFPLGAIPSRLKAAECRQALRDGASEIDMVMSIGLFKDGRYDAVRKDIRMVADLCHTRHARCKVILETCLLTDDEKRRACALCVEGGADFVKTSTGFNQGGATVEDVRVLSAAVAGSGLGVKASGGIRTLDGARSMLEAGATRLGVSAGMRILREARDLA